MLNYFILGFGFMIVCFIIAFLVACFLNFLLNTKPIYGILLCCFVMGLVFMATRIPFKMPKVNFYLMSLVHSKIVHNFLISFIIGFLSFELIYHLFIKNKKRKPEYRRGTMDMPPVPPEELPYIKNKEIVYNPDDWELVWDYYGKDFGGPMGRISLSYDKIYHHKKYPNLVSYDDEFWWCYDRLTEQFFRVNKNKFPTPTDLLNMLPDEIDLTYTFTESKPMTCPELTKEEIKKGLEIIFSKPNNLTKSKDLPDVKMDLNQTLKLLEIEKDILEGKIKDRKELIKILKDNDLI